MFISAINQSPYSFYCRKNPINRLQYILCKKSLYQHRYTSRNALKKISPEQLNDLGITKEQALTESNKPFWK
jgi:uncharacterized protein YjiS (DUF1127 family)